MLDGISNNLLLVVLKSHAPKRRKSMCEHEGQQDTRSPIEEIIRGNRTRIIVVHVQSYMSETHRKKSRILTAVQETAVWETTPGTTARGRSLRVHV